MGPLAWGCHRATPAERAVEALYARLDAAADILEAHKGHQGEALWALEALYRERAREIVAWRKIAPHLDETLPEAARQRYAERVDAYRNRFETLVVAYPKPRPLLEAISRLY